MTKTFTRILFCLLSWALMPSAHAQVIFLEDFDGIAGPTAGGPGTYNFAAGWKLANVDNRTPNVAVAYIKQAWERREDFKYNVKDSCAMATSWYNPTGQADDWMWTPAISLPAGTVPKLSWNSVAYDLDFRDGYEVRIMTVAPVGGIGDIGNMLSSSTQLFTIAAENNTWTQRSVSLAAYAGQTVYIGFRCTSNDKFVLAIDDVKVEVDVDADAQVDSTTKYEYALNPLPQTNVALGGSVKNSGSAAITGVNLNALIYDNHGALVYSATSTAVGSIAPGGRALFTIPSWAPADTGTYTIRYYPTLSQTDGMTSNDTVIRTFTVSDTIFSRDDGVVTGELGIGAGNGYLGQAYTITSPAVVSSISMYFTGGYTGQRYAAVIWNTTGNGVPNTIIASTDTLLYVDDNAVFSTIPIHGGALSLAAGNYVVTAVEFDSTLMLGATNGIFTPGKEWARWSENPWLNYGTISPSFQRTLMIRMNIHDPSTLPVQLTSVKAFEAGGNVQVQWIVQTESSMKEYQVERSADARTFTTAGAVAANNRNAATYNWLDLAPVQGNNYYRIKSVSKNGDFAYSQVVKVVLGDKKSDITIYPNPVKNGALSLYLNAMKKGTYTLSLYNANGQNVFTKTIVHSGGNATQTLQFNTQLRGIYQLQITGTETRMVKQVVLD